MLAYLLEVIAIAVLERLMPHERAWFEPDGQVRADLGHTATLKGATFVLSYFAVSTGSAWAADGAPWWPSSLPMWLQVSTALVIAELALYGHPYSRQPAYKGCAVKIEKLTERNAVLGWPALGWNTQSAFSHATLCS